MTVAEARRNFRIACEVYEPRGTVRKHPLASPFVAMLAGFALVRIMKPAVARMAAVPVALQAAQLAIKLITALRKN